MQGTLQGNMLHKKNDIKEIKESLRENRFIRI